MRSLWTVLSDWYHDAMGVPRIVAADAAPFAIDVSVWPLVRLHVFGELDRDGVEALIAEFDETICRQAAPYMLLIDGRGATLRTSEIRHRFAQYALEIAEHRRIYCRGEAIVIGSPLLRGTLTAIRWLAPSTCPSRTFASLDEAQRWLDAGAPP